MSTIVTTAYHIKDEKNPTEVIHPNLSDLPGLLFLVVLAVHSVVDLLTCPQSYYKYQKYKKDFNVKHNYYSISRLVEENSN